MAQNYIPRELPPSYSANPSVFSPSRLSSAHRSSRHTSSLELVHIKSVKINLTVSKKKKKKAQLPTWLSFSPTSRPRRFPVDSTLYLYPPPPHKRPTPRSTQTGKLPPSPTTTTVLQPGNRRGSCSPRVGHLNPESSSGGPS